MQSVRVPFPCVVYTKQGPGGHYTFSHYSQQQALKVLPRTLRVSDLRGYDHGQTWASLNKACFLVLVAGDTAQCVCIANAAEGKWIRFLYRGSAFARPSQGVQQLHSELSEAYVPLHFHGTMAVYDRWAGMRAVIPIESGIALFPRQILDKDIVTLARWVMHCARRSMQASVWVTNNGDSYGEISLQLSQKANADRPARTDSKASG